MVVVAESAAAGARSCSMSHEIPASVRILDTSCSCVMTQPSSSATALSSDLPVSSARTLRALIRYASATHVDSLTRWPYGP